MSLKLDYNSICAKRHYYRRDLVLKSRPKVWFVELTNFCNLDCIMCPRSQMKRKIGFMDFKVFQRIIKQIRGFSDFVYLHMFGESLFHPGIGRFIDYCDAMGVKPHLSTNATIMDPNKASQLLNSKLRYLVLSLDGANPSTYEKVRKGGNFEESRRNIENFLKLKKRMNRNDLPVKVQIIRMKETDAEKEEFRKQWRDDDAEIVFKNFVKWGNQVPPISEMEVTTGSRITEQRYPCIELWTGGGFQWNGDFVICCMDYDGVSAAGNIMDRPLAEIWNSEKMKRWRTEHVYGSYALKLCKNCSEWRGWKEELNYPYSRMLSKMKQAFNAKIRRFPESLEKRNMI